MAVGSVRVLGFVGEALSLVKLAADKLYRALAEYGSTVPTPVSRADQQGWHHAERPARTSTFDTQVANLIDIPPQTSNKNKTQVMHMPSQRSSSSQKLSFNQAS